MWKERDFPTKIYSILYSDKNLQSKIFPLLKKERQTMKELGT